MSYANADKTKYVTKKGTSCIKYEEGGYAL
jgi:hypothetical protein